MLPEIESRSEPLTPRPPQAIIACFLGRDLSTGISPLGAGLINATYRVDTERGSYVLQRINAKVFPAPERIMANLSQLQAQSAAHPELDIRLPRLLMAADGHPFVRDADNGLWRLMEYIHPSRTLSSVQNDAQAIEIGRTLGRFHRLGAKLNPDALKTTLPGFHHTPTCLAALDAALDGADSTSRRNRPMNDEIGQALAFIATRRSLVHQLEDARRRGLTRIRVIHGDPKLDNLLFHQHSDQALCFIDLDTVQPGLIHYDIGDCLRSCCKSTGETATTVRFDTTICGNILGAYAEQVRHLLSPAEVELIYPAIRLIPFELGLRFLTDHLQGDRYFRVSARGENLQKARIQFALVAEIERHVDSIKSIVQSVFGNGRPQCG